MVAPDSMGSHGHCKHVLAPKSEKMQGGMVEEYTTYRGALSASSCLAAPHTVGGLGCLPAPPSE